MSRSVSVVIPNYNGKSLLEANIPTVIAALEFSKLQYEVIVPDDASKDDSVNFLKSNFPNVIVLEGKNNLGFSGNINRGLRAAKYDLVLTLNSDMSLKEDYFTHQLECFNDPNVFGTMGAVYELSTKEIVSSDMYPVQDFFGFVRAGKVPNYKFDKQIPIYFVSGCALLDRKKLIALDYYNELFSPYYGEDADLGLRAWKMGWSNVYEPRSICYHGGSVTIKKHSTKKKVRLISRRNKLIFHDLHLEGAKRALFFIKMALDIVFRALILDFGFYKALYNYWKVKPQIQKIRKESQFIFGTQKTLDMIRSKMVEAISDTTSR